MFVFTYQLRYINCFHTNVMSIPRDEGADVEADAGTAHPLVYGSEPLENTARSRGLLSASRRIEMTFLWRRWRIGGPAGETTHVLCVRDSSGKPTR
tara:strand:- start:1701 stop:1988 length:288 start_codon:yes stop_codon:yes gene_type:complete